VETTRKLALRRLLLVTDGAIVLGSMLAAFWLHAVARDVLPLFKDVPRFREYAALAYLTLPVWLLLILVLRLDRTFERPANWTEIALDLLKLHAAGLVALALILFLTQSVVNRSLVALFLACTLTLMFAERAALSRWLRYQHESGLGRARILLAGDDLTAMTAFVSEAARDPLPPHFVGYVSARAAALTAPLGAVPHLGAAADLEPILHQHAADEVLFFAPFDDPERVPDAMRVLDMLGVPASFVVKRREPSGVVPQVRSYYGQPFLTFDVSPKPPAALAVKHGVDVVAAAGLLLLALPLLAAIALAIWFTMGGPVLFAQERAGLYGRRFRMLKFRTMVPGAEDVRDALLPHNEMSGPVFKVTDDPRVTTLGRCLRRWSLDELPQLLNVLQGTMSLVGPRPLPIEEQQQIRGWHRRRLSMKPGLSGLWQVSGRNEVDFEDWMQLDLRYIDEWSLWLDAWILLQTIPAVLFARGSR
jgi:exopolysaccharide biosynthesis polyprenyl glycosylphosphotransferase